MTPIFNHKTRELTVDERIIPNWEATDFLRCVKKLFKEGQHNLTDRQATVITSAVKRGFLKDTCTGYVWTPEGAEAITKWLYYFKQ